MQLEDYFEFDHLDTCDRIRIKGTRIAIEHILGPYLGGESPERIHYNYRHSLDLEQVHATITYYLHNKLEVEKYLKNTHEFEEAAYQEYLKREPPEVVKRMRALAWQVKEVAP